MTDAETAGSTPRTSSRAAPRAALAPPVIAYAVLTIAAAIVPALIAGHAAWTSDANLLDVYQHHQGAARAQGLLTTAAAVPLAVLTAISSDRIRTFGLDVPGRLIALVGGVASATLLATSGLISVALLGRHTTGSLPLLQFGQRLATALGGTGFTVFIGLLVAGMSITGLLGRILPRPLALAGIAVAVLAELALLTTLTDAADPLLPIARLGSLIFLLVAAFTMHPRTTTAG